VSVAQRKRQQEIPEYPGWVPKEKECRREGCSITFMPKAPAAAYCSIACRDEAVRGQRRVTDKTKRARRKQIELAEREGRPLTRTCALEGCDVEFVPEHPRSAYCSVEHRNESTQILKARSRARKQGKTPPLMPTSATKQAVELIDAAARATPGEASPEAQDYIAHLWKRVNEDPDCPPHVYDRLERLLGVTPEGSTMPRADGD
jgi:hypothetical protein